MKREGNKVSFKGYFQKFMLLYPGNPSQAFWRTLEALLLQDESFVYPLLDAGCGDGKFARVFFGGLGMSPDVGCDISESKVRQAASLGIYREVKTADMLNLPFPNACFSTVFSNCVMEHIPDDIKALREIYRVLKKGGFFIFTVPSEEFINNLPSYRKRVASGLMEEAEKVAHRLNERLQHYHYRSPCEWEKELNKIGFNMDKYAYYLFPEAEKAWEIFFRLEEFSGKLPWGLRIMYSRAVNFVARFLLNRRRLLLKRSSLKGGGLLIRAQKKSYD